jgi:hypothetical protein
MLLLGVAVICGFLAGRMSAIRPLELARKDAESARKEANEAVHEQFVLRTQVIEDPLVTSLGEDPINDQCDAYWAQSFVAERAKVKQLVLLGRAIDEPVRLRILLVQLIDSGATVPGPIVFQSDVVEVPLRRLEGYNVVVVDLDDTDLKIGATYAFVLDALSLRKGIQSRAGFLGAHRRRGNFYSIRANDGTLSEHLEHLFKAKYSDRGLAYRIVYE